MEHKISAVKLNMSLFPEADFPLLASWPSVITRAGEHCRVDNIAPQHVVL